MSFISYGFIALCIVTFCGFYVFPQKFKWLWLMAINVVFYLWAGVGRIFYIIVTALISWFGCLLISKIHDKEKSFLKENRSQISKDERKAIKKQYERQRKKILVVMLFFILGQLVFVKYNGFVLQNINHIFRTAYEPLGNKIPLGISFYTVFCIGYCIDVYRGQYEAQKNLIKHFMLLSYFPCITQGPIERYDHLQEEVFKEHHLDWEQLLFGMELMLWGFFKKMVIADNLSVATNAVFTDETGTYSGIYIFLAAFLYAIQLYTDFSGYVDIASGFSQALGISLIPNFDTPYFSKSIAEFWRRWHMSLGSWFKDYVFYSALRSEWCQAIGKECKKYFSRTVVVSITTTVGLLVNWMIIGLWHGAAWKYVAHGLYYGFIMIFSIWMKPVYENVIKKLNIKTDCFSYRFFQTIRTFTIVTFGYILFCARNVTDFVRLIKEMIFHINPWIFFDGGIFTMGIDQKSAFVLAVAVIVLFIVDFLHFKDYSLRKELKEQNIWFRWILLYGLLACILVFGSYGSGYNANDFIYQDF